MSAAHTERDATQGTIVSTRRIVAPRALVYEAWTRLDHRRQWFKGPKQTEVARSLDLRVGGTELAHGRFDDTGRESIYTARFHLIEPEVRLIYDFDMHVDGEHFSVSLTRVDFEDAPGGTDLTYTEHAFFLRDDSLEGRIEGTEILMDQITAYVTTLADQPREDAR